jgi:hypothetical protein
MLIFVFSTTSSYITSLQKGGKVTIYLVPPSYNLPLDIATFLTILERANKKRLRVGAFYKEIL